MIVRVRLSNHSILNMTAARYDGKKERKCDGKLGRNV